MEEPAVYVEWKGQEFEFVAKSMTWYWTIGILSLGCAVAAFIVGNFLFGVILLLAGMTVSLLGSRRPATHLFRITDRGIYVSDQLFTYDNVESFAIDDHMQKGGVPTELHFSLKKALVKVMTVPLGGADYRAVRTALKNHNIDEVKSLDSAVARLSDWMGIG
jgi:hypothetical protein